MTEPGIDQIRYFRLKSHHLDTAYSLSDIPELAGACGLQNSPPGAWETALYNRVPDCSLTDMERLLYEEKSLLQAWSLRGAPIVFPASESGVFLSALTPAEDEPWIYTRGITLALDFLHMEFDELLELLKQVISRLDEQAITTKSALDQTLAEWMVPLLPSEKRDLWNQPSMYGSPDIQTVGGAVVSFLLRPCAFNGLVVFGRREGISPTFTSYRNWTGASMAAASGDEKALVRKYLHCYGPATVDMFINWLGCSGKQGRRLWKLVSEEMEPVTVFGKKAYILSEDREQLFAPAPWPENSRLTGSGRSQADISRELLLLGGHDPFLDQRDRAVLQPDQALQKQIWKLVSNPGAVVYRGEVVGIWTSKKKSRGMEMKVTLWRDLPEKQRLCDLAEEHASFRQQKLINLTADGL